MEKSFKNSISMMSARACRSQSVLNFKAQVDQAHFYKSTVNHVYAQDVSEIQRREKGIVLT